MGLGFIGFTGSEFRGLVGVQVFGALFLLPSRNTTSLEPVRKTMPWLELISQQQETRIRAYRAERVEVEGLSWRNLSKNPWAFLGFL